MYGFYTKMYLMYNLYLMTNYYINYEEILMCLCEYFNYNSIYTNIYI